MRTTYRNQDGKLIKGTIFSILTKGYREKSYFLTDLKVYADGYIDCLGYRSIKEIEKLLNLGKLSVILPKNNELFIPYIGYIGNSYSTENKSVDEYIKILEHTIKKLNIVSKTNECVQAFKEYLINFTENDFKKLKEIYHSLPEKERSLFETENKDPLVKLMENKIELSLKLREYYLNDYFEGEWLELK